MQNTVKLNSGNTIPVVGLGTWESEKNQAGNAVSYAITEAGYTHIDCAAAYGNEQEIGKVLGDILKTSVLRENLFITSKLWNTNHRTEDIEPACSKTIKDLRVEYLDLYLMHWGIAFKHGAENVPIGTDDRVILDKISIRETWTVMESLVKKGLVKSIGVANFTVPMLIDLLSYATIVPAMNQVELHPYNVQKELIDFCAYRSIAVTAYSPLGRQGVKTSGPKLFDEKIILDLSKKYKKSPSQILLHWAIGRGTVVIPKSVTPERIAENINVFDFVLTQEEKDMITALNRNHRFVDPTHAWGIPYFA